MNLENNRAVEFSRRPPLFDSRYFFFLAIISFIGSVVTPAFGQRIARNAIYLEAASKGPAYSLNYDRLIRQGKKLDYSLRVGFSIEHDAVSFPMGFNFITSGYDHHAELGLTIIPYFEYYDNSVARNYSDKSDKYLFINPAVGYRFQKTGRSVLLKASMGPSIFLDPAAADFWNMEPKVYFFGSVAAGISF